MLEKGGAFAGIPAGRHWQIWYYLSHASIEAPLCEISEALADRSVQDAPLFHRAHANDAIACRLAGVQHPTQKLL